MGGVGLRLPAFGEVKCYFVKRKSVRERYFRPQAVAAGVVNGICYGEVAVRADVAPPPPLQKPRG